MALAASILLLPLGQVLRAETLLLSLNMVENSALPRTGTLKVYAPDTPNPYLADGFAGPFVVDWWARLNWESICSQNISLGGGSAEGWVFDITAFDPSFSGLFNSVYAVVAGSFLSEGDGSSAQRTPCNSGSIPLDYAIALVYVYNPEERSVVPGRGTLIGQVLYVTDYSPEGQLYFLYNPS
jgi:hypothetical protein